MTAWNSYTGEMIGDHCAAVIADAYVKGLLDSQDELAHQAWEVIRKNAFEVRVNVMHCNGYVLPSIHILEVYNVYMFG